MPLIVTSLESELKDAFRDDNLAPLTAAKTAQAITNYWGQGMSVAGGTVQATASIPIIQSGLASAWAQAQPSVASAASAMADAIDAGFLVIIVAGGVHGIGGVQTSFKAVLIPALISAMAFPPSRELFATQFAQAIDVYTKTGIIFGTGVPPIPPPPPGPLI